MTITAVCETTKPRSRSSNVEERCYMIYLASRAVNASTGNLRQCRFTFLLSVTRCIFALMNGMTVSDIPPVQVHQTRTDGRIDREGMRIAFPSREPS